MKKQKTRKYTFTEETAQRYLDTYGAAFKAALWDKQRTNRDVAEQYDLDYATIYMLRKTLVPDEHRTIRAHKVTPEMIRAFKSHATNEELAKRFKIPYATLERIRRRYIGKRMREPLRLTPQTMAMLRSSFSDRVVGKALGICTRSAWRHRVVLGIKHLVTTIEVTDEQRAIIASSKNDQICANALGTTHAKARYMRFLHREGLL
jgi:hypothetical protein